MKKNNSKEWFEKHRSEYDEFVLHPAREFVIEMGKKLRKKVPRGYDAEHPHAEYLLYNGLTARVEEKVPDAFFSDAIIDYAYGHYKNMLPLHRWLKKALSE